MTVNDLYPTGGVATDGIKYVFRNRGLSDEVLESMKTPEEIAEAALWIACQDAATFSGRSVNDEEVKAFIEGRARP